LKKATVSPGTPETGVLEWWSDGEKAGVSNFQHSIAPLLQYSVFSKKSVNHDISVKKT